MTFIKSYWFRSGTYSLFGYAAQLGFAFVAFLVLVRLLPSRDFGVWVLYTSLASMLEMARNGLVQNGLIRYCAERPEAYPQILSAGLWLNFLSSIGLALLLLAMAYPLGRLWSAPELPVLFWWNLPFTALLGTARYLEAVHMANSDFRGVFLSKFSFGFVFLLGIGAWWWGRGAIPLESLPVLQVLSAALALVVIISAKPRYLHFGPLEYPWVRRLFQFGKYVLGTNFSSMIFSKLDVLVIGTFLNPLAVATYNVASRISNYLEAPMTSLAQVVYPKMAEAGREPDRRALAGLFEKSLALLLALALPCTLLLILLARPVILLLAGREYLGATSVLMLLLLTMAFKPWGRLTGILLDALDKPRLNFLILTANLVLQLPLQLLLVPQLGIMGAALALLIATALHALAGQLIIARLLPVNGIRVLPEIAQWYIRIYFFLIRKIKQPWTLPSDAPNT